MGLGAPSPPAWDATGACFAVVRLAVVRLAGAFRDDALRAVVFLAVDLVVADLDVVALVGAAFFAVEVVFFSAIEGRR